MEICIELRVHTRGTDCINQNETLRSDVTHNHPPYHKTWIWMHDRSMWHCRGLENETGISQTVRGNLLSKFHVIHTFWCACLHSICTLLQCFGKYKYLWSKMNPSTLSIVLTQDLKLHKTLRSPDTQAQCMQHMKTHKILKFKKNENIYQR